jgi:hypothetical protein
MRTLQAVRDFRLNNLGQVAFLADFADGTSAILISNPIVVPEPETLLAAWLAIIQISLAYALSKRTSSLALQSLQSTALVWYYDKALRPR